MKIPTYENIIANDHGETLVEVMVSFIVLMIVLAMFSSTITFGSSSIMRSIETRRTSDNEYIVFRNAITTESRTNVISYNSDGDPNTIDCIRTSTESKVETISTTDDSTIELAAYQYKSGDTIYWVFR
jgi:hypothetical protein